MTLLELRKKHGLSQVELAQQINISQCMISKIEKGNVKPSPEVAMRIGELFNLNSAQIWETLYAPDKQLISSP